MANTGVHVLLRVKWIGHVQLSRSRRHQLHQPHCSLSGDCVGVEVGFHLDHRADQVGIDVVPCRSLFNRGVNLLGSETISTNKAQITRALRIGLAQIVVDLRGCGSCRTHGSATGSAHRFPATLLGAPVDQARTPRSHRFLCSFGSENNFIDIHLMPVFVTGSDGGRGAATGTRRRLHGWRSERKEGRDYGTGHQDELQAFVHRVYVQNRRGANTPLPLPAT